MQRRSTVTDATTQPGRGRNVQNVTLWGSEMDVARRIAIAAASSALALAAVPSQPAHASVTWLCRPGLANSPCTGDQTTTYTKPDGSSHVSSPRPLKPPPVDCFYVYPTVSNEPTPNATKTAAPEINSIVKYQAQRFSQRCRLYVPLYRQATTAAVAFASQTHDTTAYTVAFGD
ncbi:MAG: hypothetical protein QOG86_27, partial [Thermoleophilaceae bacterium]|nr:hypothetical protein [Thermoleophilaceae bacterium]